MNDDTGHTPELHSILDEYLEAVRRGATVADCLAGCRARYGEQAAAELRPALEAAVLTAHLRQPAMPPASVDALELRLRGAMVSRRRAPALSGLGRLAAMVAIVMIALLGTGGGAVVASENAVPGDVLYPVKRLWEEIVLALAPLGGEPDAVWLWIAQRRLWEAEALAARGQLTQEALADLLDAMEQAVTLAAPARQPALRAYLDDVRAAISPLTPPPGAESVYEQVLHDAAPPADALPPAPSETPGPVVITFTPTVTATASPTPPLPTLTLTPTSRVPATLTRTPLPPSPTPTAIPPSATPGPSATPTQTWTPLPLPASPVFTPLPPATLPPATLPPALPTFTPELLATERWRETQAAVYLTQTAQAQPNSAPELATETPP